MQEVNVMFYEAPFYIHCSVSAMVNNLRHPPASSLTHPLLPTLSSSSVTNSELHSHPSHNIETHSNQNSNNLLCLKESLDKNLRRPKKSFRYQKVSSSHEPERASRPHHHTMRGGGLAVDLLSAFGILHNISVHEPNVVLRPGAHSSSPAALFSSSYQSDSGTEISRNVRLDLRSLNYWEYNSEPNGGHRSSPMSKNVSKLRNHIVHWWSGGCGWHLLT